MKGQAVRGGFMFGRRRAGQAGRMLGWVSRLGLVLSGLGSVLGVFCVSGCTKPAPPAIEHPMVTFRAPKGLVMYVAGHHGALKVTFTGNKGPAPFLCSSKPWLVDVNGDPDSVRTFMERLATRPGSKKVLLYDAKGRLLARGAFCVFPTYKTRASAIKDHYEIRIPQRALERLEKKAGPVALFQTYPPSEPHGKLTHVAWSLYLYSF